MKRPKTAPAVRARPAKAKVKASRSTPRVLVTTSLKIGEDQREALRDLAREEQRAGRQARFDLSALVREAIDRLLAERRRGAA